jgi:hypothetical protein
LFFGKQPRENETDRVEKQAQERKEARAKVEEGEEGGREGGKEGRTKRNTNVPAVRRAKPTATTANHNRVHGRHERIIIQTQVTRRSIVGHGDDLLLPQQAGLAASSFVGHDGGHQFLKSGEIDLRGGRGRREGGKGGVENCCWCRRRA